MRGTSGRVAGGGPGGANTPTPVVKLERGHSSKDVLSLDWDFAVIGSSADAPEIQAGRSHAALKRQALPREQAFRAVAGDDPRPLLVLRECGWCEGSDDALLSSRFENEKTILLMRWFHAIKLPNHVLEADHEFRNLFEGEAPPHLFVATRDGSVALGLDGQQSQSQLWNVMGEVITQVYGADAERTVKSLYRMLDELDMLDADETRLRERMDVEVEKKGPGSSRFKKLQAQLAATLEERDAVRAEVDTLLAEPLSRLSG